MAREGRRHQGAVGDRERGQGHDKGHDGSRQAAEHLFREADAGAKTFATRYYNDMMQRPMADLDIMVPTGQVEQLRVLHHGYAIKVGVIDEPTIGIDTPDDYAAFVKRWHKD